MAQSVTIIDLDEADLDRPLYRIYPIWFLENALTMNGGNLALVPPRMWEDPHEDPCSWIQMQAPGGAQKSLTEYLKPIYAQCWSMEGQSDVLLRAYSRVSKDNFLGRNSEPKFEGVRVRTTPRLIVEALNQYLKKRGDRFLELFVAKISYVHNPSQIIVNRLGEIGPKRLGMGFDRARSLTFKRNAFAHEQELRVIVLAPLGTTSEMISVDIDPNVVFQEVLFDPRLLEFERIERENRIRAIGYNGSVTRDPSYLRTVFIAQLPKHWDVLDANDTSQS